MFVQYSPDSTDIESVMACPEGKHPDGHWMPFRKPDGALLGFRTADGKLLRPAEAPRYVKHEGEGE